MAELADALDLGSSEAIHGGSSPSGPTTLHHYNGDHMELIWIAVLVILSLITLFSLWVLLYRNDAVYNERIRIIGIITELNVRDRTFSEWRWKEYHKITYNQMVNQFWKPVKSFYEKSPAIDSRLTSAGRN